MFTMELTALPALDTKTGDKLWERREISTVIIGCVLPLPPLLMRDSLFLTFDGVDVQFVAALEQEGQATPCGWNIVRLTPDFEAVLRAKGITDTEKTKNEKPNDNQEILRNANYHHISKERSSW